MSSVDQSGDNAPFKGVVGLQGALELTIVTILRTKKQK
jgi:hypothetical protein